jgi:hypothetical protein
MIESERSCSSDRSQEVVMVTYRRELERKGWHRNGLVRLVLVVAALFVGLLGYVTWTFEQDKGGWEDSGLGHHMVEAGEVGDPVRVWNENGEIVFEGTSIEEAEAWIESRRSRNFTVPSLLLVGSAVLFLLGVGPSPRKQEPAEPPLAAGV